MRAQSVIVIGAGIVGLSIAWHLRQGGADVIVVDRDPDGDKASFGNAGGIAVTECVPASVPGVLWRVPFWLIDPLGPLSVRPAHALKLLPWLARFARAGQPGEVARIAAALAALNARVYDDLLPMLAATGLSDQFNRVGALTVYETEAGYRRDAPDWALRRAHGIVVEDLTGDESRDMEPALGAAVVRGVYTPAWSHVNDPKRLVDRLRSYLQARGIRIIQGDVARILPQDGMDATLKLNDGTRLTADRIVVAAGAWSGLIARQLGDAVLIESERGYNMTVPAPGVSLTREVIFAERKFVATPLSCGLRIGGAAEFGGLEAQADFRRSKTIVTLARRYLPDLNTEGGVAWAGHRPTTPDSLPVLGPSPSHPSVLYAFGHGHLGLTQAATTGRLIANLVFDTPPPIDLAPYSINRFT